MQVDELNNLIGDGRFAGVTFVKRGDGTTRRMLCRTGVTKGVTGRGASYDARSRGLLPVYDVQAGGWRSIPADAVVEVRAGRRVVRP